MILSGREIARQNGRNLTIEPFNSKQVNPNSYNLRLHNELLVYAGRTLDMKKNNPTLPLPIPEEGLLIFPGTIYLGRTMERTSTDVYAPMLEGRSSIGRLGIDVHISAGFGDVGFDGFWTLEIRCEQPVWIYPWIEICQIFYHHIDGYVDLYKHGKYSGNTGVQASKMWEELQG